MEVSTLHKKVGVVGLGFIIFLLGVISYLVGVMPQEIIWTFTEIGFVACAIGVLIVVTGMTLFTPHNRKKTIPTGWFIFLLSLGWFITNYPYNWDNSTEPQSLVTVIGLLGFGLSLLIIFGPVVLKYIKDVQVGKKQYYSALVMLGISTLAIISSIGVYTYTEITPGFLTEFRMISLVLLSLSTAFGVGGFLLLLDNTLYLKFTSVGIMGIYLVISIIPVQYYPDSLHQGGGENAGLFMMYISTMVILSTLTIISGYIYYSLKNYEEKNISKPIKEWAFESNGKRLRTFLRIAIGIPIIFLFSAINVLVIIFPLGLLAEMFVPFEFRFLDELVANPLNYFLAAGIGSFVAYFIGAAFVSKYIDKRDPRRLLFSEYTNIKDEIRYLFGGYVFGTSVVLILSAIMVATGWVELSVTDNMGFEFWGVMIAIIIATGLYSVGTCYTWVAWLPHNIFEGTVQKYGGAIGLILSVFISVAIATQIVIGLASIALIMPVALLFAAMITMRHITNSLLPAIGFFWGIVSFHTIVIGEQFVYGLDYSSIIEFNVVTQNELYIVVGEVGIISGLLGTITMLTVILLAFDYGYVVYGDRLNLTSSSA